MFKIAVRLWIAIVDGDFGVSTRVLLGCSPATVLIRDCPAIVWVGCWSSSCCRIALLFVLNPVIPYVVVAVNVSCNLFGCSCCMLRCCKSVMLLTFLVGVVSLSCDLVCFCSPLRLCIVFIFRDAVSLFVVQWVSAAIDMLLILTILLTFWAVGDVLQFDVP